MRNSLVSPALGTHSLPIFVGMNKIRLWWILVLVIWTSSAGAQSFYDDKEYGIALGGSHYFGDLNEYYGLKSPYPALGAFMRLHLNPYISTRLVANATRVGYSDALSSDYYTRTRNLNFESNLVELALQFEFNFFRYFTGELNSRFTPYLTGGIGGFYYNPYTYFHGEKYYLAPLGTEGQNTPEFADRTYGKTSLCFPIGMGIKYWIRPGLNLGFEIANRLTLTDYLDDVSQTYVGRERFPSDPRHPVPSAALQDRSVELGGEALGRAGKQRGNSASRDQYMLFMINLSFQLKTYKCPAFLRDGLY